MKNFISSSKFYEPFPIIENPIVYTYIYCVGAGISTLMSFSDGLCL